MLCVILGLTLLTSTLSTQAAPASARAGGAALPYPTACPSGSWRGASILTYSYNVWDFDPATPFNCIFPAGSYTASKQVVKVGQEITFTNDSGNWQIERNNPDVSPDSHYAYLQLQRIVGAGGAVGGNIDGYNGASHSTNGYTGWARVVSGCNLNYSGPPAAPDTSCTIQVDPAGATADTNDPSPLVTGPNLWYTVGGLTKDAACGASGSYCEVPFHVESGAPDSRVQLPESRETR